MIWRNYVTVTLRIPSLPTRLLLRVADTGRDVTAAAAEFRRQTSSDAPTSPSTMSAVSRAPCAESGSIQVTSSTWRETTASSSVRPTTWPSTQPVSHVHSERSLRPEFIDREFVTSAKNSRILTNFPKLKKIVKIRTKFVKCPSAGLPRVPG